ncbi:ubiquitin carboxyl-terminal hydrolase 37-like [Dendrobates tinctorius]|uniref:ubiquitin carboxyl-terminal hydrolase 37-like n=1 Tax=Dendrobates tinctorius TaxID=92724 RepID=UPI003CC9B212
MAAALSLHGSIRIHCLNIGTSKWKEGKCEVIEKDNKFTLVINFNAGGVPSKFQLNQNLKNIVLRPVGGKQSRLLLTMKDSSSLTIDKVPSKEAEQLKHLLEFINHEKPQTVKPTQGSASFGGILVNRSIHRESIRSLTNNRSQTPTKRVSFDGKDETLVKKPLNSNGRIPGKTSPKSITPSRNTPMTSTPHRTGLMETRKQSLKSTSNITIYLDSESEDEVLKRSVINQRAISCAVKDQSSEDPDKKSNLENLKCPDLSDISFDEMNDDEMMAAVLEMTRKEESLHVHNEHEEEKLASSPDTGFGGDDDMHETAETIEEEKSKAAKESGAGQYSHLTKDFDENKENKTPNGSQNDTDWMQYELEREREEQELQQALAQSLQEHEARELSEDDDLKRATELSLQEFNSSFLDGAMSDEDSGNEDMLDMEYTEEEAEELKKNAESGELPHSYRLVSVVSHIGSSSSSGHYISDAYDTKKQSWFTYNDLAVSRTHETTVQNERDRSGYIFFYMHKEIFDEMIEEEKKAQTTSNDPNRSSSRPQM